MIHELQVLDTSRFSPPPDSEEFFSECLRLLAKSEIPFLVSGTYALSYFTGIVRPTKDVDVFAKAGDCLRILTYFKEQGFEVQMVDERWLARVCRGELFLDVIFNMPTASTHVTDDWFDHAPKVSIYDTVVRIVPPTEFIWSKIFVQDRYRYDGADVAHVILKKHDEIDWRRLLSNMELYWEVLLIALLNFRFIYPSERECVPRWLFDELTDRVRAQAEMPPPAMKVCRGRLFSPRDYLPDVEEWGFCEIVGNLEERHERH